MHWFFSQLRSDRRPAAAASMAGASRVVLCLIAVACWVLSPAVALCQGDDQSEGGGTVEAAETTEGGRLLEELARGFAGIPWGTIMQEEVDSEGTHRRLIGGYELKRTRRAGKYAIYAVQPEIPEFLGVTLSEPEFGFVREKIWERFARATMNFKMGVDSTNKILDYLGAELGRPEIPEEGIYVWDGDGLKISVIDFDGDASLVIDKKELPPLPPYVNPALRELEEQERRTGVVLSDAEKQAILKRKAETDLHVGVFGIPWGTPMAELEHLLGEEMADCDTGVISLYSEEGDFSFLNKFSVNDVDYHFSKDTQEFCGISIYYDEGHTERVKELLTKKLGNPYSIRPLETNWDVGELNIWVHKSSASIFNKNISGVGY